MFRTFKTKLIHISPPDATGKKVLPDGLMWHDRLGSSTVPAIDMSNEEFELTKDEVIFSTDQISRYGDGLHIDPYGGIKFIDETKYLLNKHYRKGKVLYQIKIDAANLRMELTEWNKFKLNVIHDKYWLFNEKKWFVTFAVSIVAIIISILALFTDK